MKNNVYSKEIKNMKIISILATLLPDTIVQTIIPIVIINTDKYLEIA